ncbi:MAG: S8 family serine peptidase [Odoribacter sp.]|nr:S8 family serine peptidase [Odoribacter sp.]
MHSPAASIKFLVSCAILFTALTATSGVLDPAATIFTVSQTTRHNSRAEAPQVYVPMILQIKPDAPLDELVDLGVVVYNRRADLVLACVPRDKVTYLEDLSIMHRASLSISRQACLDRATSATGVSLISSPDFDTPLTGNGVIVGLCDTGFDPGHATFSKRVVGISNYNDTLATADHFISAAEIAEFTTDKPHEYHATHVAGIMAGDGDGSPYSGVAPGARIFASTSILYDTGILAGVEDIIDYAHRNSWPAVINLSLGTTIGPHDGSDLFCQYLDRCAAEVPILLSAGNDGQANVTIRRTFSQESPGFRVMISDRLNWDYININGYCDAWSADSRTFSLRYSVYDADEAAFVYTTPDIASTTVIDCDDPTQPLSRYFSGHITVATELSPANNRYNILSFFDLKCKAMRATGPWARYYICVETEGAPGVHVDLAADGELIGLDPLPGMGSLVSKGDGELSISSMACGKNTIAVGSATTRHTAPLLMGGEESWASIVTEGTVSGFSSYGVTADGRHLPHFCAPGAYIVSAVSRYYIDKNPAAIKSVTASGDTPRNYYMATCGTSMASPHAAGIFALWLEADPTLSPSDLRDIAISTASSAGIDINDPRSGAGMIDAVAGLREVKRRAGTSFPEYEPEENDVMIFNLQGMRVHEPLAPGIYIRRCGSRSEKFTVR